VVGAGIGSLAGLLVSFLGAGNSALIVGAAVERLCHSSCSAAGAMKVSASSR